MIGPSNDPLNSTEWEKSSWQNRVANCQLAIANCSLCQLANCFFISNHNGLRGETVGKFPTAQTCVSNCYFINESSALRAVGKLANSSPPYGGCACASKRRAHTTPWGRSSGSGRRSARPVQTTRPTITETIMTELALAMSASTSMFQPAGAILALDLGTTTGWALRCADGTVLSGTVSFRPSRYDGGGVRYLRFRAWLEQNAADAGDIAAIYHEEIRRHLSTDSAHVYGGLLATLTAWCEQRGIAYQGVPVGTIKRHVTGKGNADKAAVMAGVRARGFDPSDDNEADALAILLWAIDTQGGVR